MVTFAGLEIEVRPPDAVEKLRYLVVSELADGVWRVLIELSRDEKYRWLEVTEGVMYGVKDKDWKGAVVFTCGEDELSECEPVMTVCVRRDIEEREPGIVVFTAPVKYGVEMIVIDESVIFEAERVGRVLVENGAWVLGGAEK